VSGPNDRDPKLAQWPIEGNSNRVCRMPKRACKSEETYQATHTSVLDSNERRCGVSRELGAKPSKAQIINCTAPYRETKEGQVATLLCSLTPSEQRTEEEP
jgi:hypothetical protein